MRTIIILGIVLSALLLGIATCLSGCVEAPATIITDPCDPLDEIRWPLHPDWEKKYGDSDELSQKYLEKWLKTSRWVKRAKEKAKDKKKK